jgi:hypothetical protein
MNGLMRIFVFLLSLIFFLTTCRSKRTFHEPIETITDTVISNPLVQVLKDKNSFRVPAIGWTVRIPEKWKKSYKEKDYQLDEDEQDKIDDLISSKTDNNSQILELVTIYKNRLNNFISTMEPFDETNNGSYDDRNMAVHEGLKSAYAAKKIYAEYEVAAKRIDGIMFDIFDIRVYTHDKRRVSLYQSIFNSLINGYYFTVIINYNNEADKDSFLNIIETSKFSMKH